MGPWSKLERRLRDLPDPALDLRLRFTAYRRDVIETPHWSEVAGRFWITPVSYTHLDVYKRQPSTPSGRGR